MNEPLRTMGELEQTLLSRKKTDRDGLPGLEKGRKRSHSRLDDHHPDGDEDAGNVESLGQRSGAA